jgi:PAS domain S-box-containing protein
MDQHKQINDIAFEALFSHATIGIITVDAGGIIILANPYSLFQFGYEKEEVLGQRVEILIPTKFAAHHDKLRDGFTRHPQSRSMGVGLDLFARRKDGSEFPVEISLSNYEINTKIYVIAFVIDITIRKINEQSIKTQQLEKEHITEELKLLNEELEQKVESRTTMLRETLHQLEKSRDELTEALEKEKELNDLKSRFVTMASHEFRTPLSTILSSVSLIDKYKLTEEEDKREKHIQRIKAQVRNLANILEEFLSLGRLEEGQVIEKKKDINIREMMDEIVSEMNNLAKKGQFIDVEYKGIEIVNIDKSLLRNVLINLISNALKYSGEKGKVNISVINTIEGLKINIKDNGIGISKEDVKHLTERFFRGKNVINIQGTGLGLHIVKKYLEVMNGDIKFFSMLMHGTEVRLTFNKKII